MKIAVVTGAAGGMGRAITARLIADGLHMAGLDIDGTATAELEAAFGTAFPSLPVDLTDPVAITAAFGRMSDLFGGLDALVNNAGTCVMSDFPEIPPAELARHTEVNFHSAFLGCKAAVP